VSQVAIGAQIWLVGSQENHSFFIERAKVSHDILLVADVQHLQLVQSLWHWNCSLFMPKRVVEVVVLVLVIVVVSVVVIVVVITKMEPFV